VPDKRVTELAVIDTVMGSDLVMVIDDPSGTAVNKKATVTQIAQTIQWIGVSLGGSRAASLPLAAGTYDLVNAEPAFTVPTLSVSSLATARIVADVRSTDPSANITPRLVNASTLVVAGTGVTCTASNDDYTGTNQHQTVAVTLVGGQTYKAQAIVAGAGAASNATFCTIRLEIG
jgi:hypothetical protein